MWVMLENQLNKSYSRSQRSIHASDLHTIKPRPGERIRVCYEPAAVPNVLSTEPRKRYQALSYSASLG